MDGFEDAVALGIGDGAFALGVTSPQHVNDALLALCDGSHDRIGEGFPAVSCVGGRFVRPDRQHGIEQQHALFGPAVEVAARGNRRAGVVGYLLEDVLQRGWERHAVRHGETESVGLSFAVIGVLSDDYHFEFVERAFVEGTKNVASSGEYPAGSVFLPYAMANGEAYMAMGETLPELRGRGIGGWLIPYLANELAGEGWTVTFLCAAERCRFYERLGFVLQKQYVKYKL